MSPCCVRCLASDTYGPLPGPFAFGMMTTRTLCDRLGLELPIVNGVLVGAGPFAVSRRATACPVIAVV